MSSSMIHRSIAERIRSGLTWKQTWRDRDRGVIKCWEVGRGLRLLNPEVAAKAEDGQLPILGWKGGVDRPLKSGVKQGSLNYLAQWQGLCNQDLAIDLEGEQILVCSSTGVKVIFN